MYTFEKQVILKLYDDSRSYMIILEVPFARSMSLHGVTACTNYKNCNSKTSKGFRHHKAMQGVQREDQSHYISHP